MNHEIETATGWMISGFQYWAALWVWVGAVLLYGLWRSVVRTGQDPIRRSGPTGL